MFNIFSCSVLDIPNTAYVLTQDIEDAVPGCIKITGEQIIFGGNGHSIIRREGDWKNKGLLEVEGRRAEVRNFYLEGALVYLRGEGTYFHNNSLSRVAVLSSGSDFLIEKNSFEDSWLKIEGDNSYNLFIRSRKSEGLDTYGILLENKFIAGDYSSESAVLIETSNILSLDNSLSGFENAYFLSYYGAKGFSSQCDSFLENHYDLYIEKVKWYDIFKNSFWGSSAKEMSIYYRDSKPNVLEFFEDNPEIELVSGKC